MSKGTIDTVWSLAPYSSSLRVLGRIPLDPYGEIIHKAVDLRHLSCLKFLYLIQCGHFVLKGFIKQKEWGINSYSLEMSRVYDC